METLMHIPTALLMPSFSLEALREKFADATGDAPTGVVYDAFSAVGPNFQSKYYRDNLATGDNEAADVGRVKQECDRLGLSFWLCFNPSMAFAASIATHLVDSHGDSSRQCCLYAPGTRSVMELLAKEARDRLAALQGDSVQGVVIPAQDLWPMGAKNNILEVTCFCRHCSDFYTSNGLENLEQFDTPNSPFKLALRDSGTGIGHIDSITSRTTPEMLLEQSRSHGMLAADLFDGIDAGGDLRSHPNWNAARQKAETLLRFVHVRHELTVRSLRAIAETLKDIFQCPAALIVDGAAYDWTAGFLFDLLVREDWVDEIWLPQGGTTPIPREQSIRWYCTGRAGYLVYQFCEKLELLRSPQLYGLNVSQNPSRLHNQIRSIAKTLQGFVLASPGDYVAIRATPDDRYTVRGLVTPVLFTSTIPQLLEGVPGAGSRGTTEDILRDLLRGLG